jgi:hypothetical protein
MIIHSLSAEFVKGIGDLKEISIRESGITLISGLNESGKSTLASVPFFLLTYPSSARNENIRNLESKKHDRGPFMAMEFSVNGSRYKLSKRWIKDISTELQQLSPRVETFTGDKAEIQLKVILGDSKDETLWRILNSLQGQGIEIFSSTGELSDNDFLSQAIDFALAGEASEDDQTSIVEAVEKEYLDYWTASAVRLTSKAGTKGARMAEIQRTIEDLRTSRNRIEEALDKAESIKEAKASQEIDRGYLQKVRETQSAINRWRQASAAKETLNKKLEAVSESESKNPSAINLDIETFEVAQKTHASFVALQALQKIKISALQSFSLRINGATRDLSKGDSINQPMTPGLIIEIEDLIKIEFQGEGASNELESESAAHQQALKALGVATLTEASTLKNDYDGWVRAKGELDAFLSSNSADEIEAKFSASENQKISYGEFWQEADAAPEVSESDLIQAVEVESNTKGRLDEIAEQRYLEDLIDIDSKITSSQSEYSKLKIEADAIKLLRETIASHRLSAGAEYAEIFQSRLNELVSLFFGEMSTLEVDEEFNITARAHGGILLPINLLSIGAQEQIAILVRLTLCLLTANLEPLPLILDDEFGSTDPSRLAKMLQIISGLGSQQILLYTCNPEKFDLLNLTAIEI